MGSERIQEQPEPSGFREQRGGEARDSAYGVVVVGGGMAGLPIGVQVVARPWREHVALSAMRTIEQAVRGRKDDPGIAPFEGETTPLVASSVKGW